MKWNNIQDSVTENGRERRSFIQKWKKKWKTEKTEFTRKAGQWCRENIKSGILILSTTLLIRDGFEKEDSIKTGKETIITPKLQSSTQKKNI